MLETVQIDIYISDLLYSYDCVIVPDFGGFVANYAPAKIKEVQHQFLPPSKQISFNKNLKNNDGLLTNHISQRREISFQEANQMIRAFVDRSIAGLKNGDKIKINKVGVLYLDPEENIQFIQEEKNDFLLDSFGLQSFRALPIERDSVEERIQDKLKTGEVFSKTEGGSSKVVWRAAAIIFFLLSSFLLLDSQVDRSDLGDLQYSIFSPSIDKDPQYTSRESAIEVDDASTELAASSSLKEKSLSNYIPTEGEPTSIWIEAEEEEVVEAKVDNTDVVNETTKPSLLKFHVMGGCFSNYSNATGLTDQLKSSGYDARLLGEYKNLHAVSYGSFARKEDALELLNQVKAEHNSSAWLLEKSF